MKREFVVVQGEQIEVENDGGTFIHFDCPFCSAHGAVPLFPAKDNPENGHLPEFFGVDCSENGETFLVQWVGV